MKLRTRLVLSFCLIIILPIVLASFALSAFYQMQERSIRQTYDIDSTEETGLFSNSLQLMSQYTKQEFEQLEEMAEDDPDILTDPDYLEDVNASLEEKSSFLICRSGDQILYDGGLEEDETDDKLLSQLPTYGEYHQGEGTSYYYIQEEQALVRQVDFLTYDGTESSIYIVTSAESILPEVQKMLFTALVVIIMILALTSGLIVSWLYNGVMNPVRKLKKAMANIRDGNLDYEIKYDEDDEIGDLCQDFNEMRRHLKASTEEKVNAEKENRALISNIAHDLKTPITTLKGYAEGLLDGVATTEEKQEQYLRMICNKANEMDALINELTLYAKIDTNRIPYNFNKIDVTDYFEDCVEEIRMDLETRGIDLSYSNELESKVCVIGDPEQLMRVVNNIINNSVKYMAADRNGQINIRIRDVGDFIQVELEDNGKGIATRDLPYIFDRFYRTDSSRNSSTGGSGIGLSIVKKIIEDHGGRIWATSRENAGTTMYFVLRKYQEVIINE